jgi:hypothetical protein
MKRNLWLVILLIVWALLVIFYFKLQRKNFITRPSAKVDEGKIFATEAQTPTLTKFDSSNWQTYKVDNFNIKYPNDWKIDEKCNMVSPKRFLLLRVDSSCGPIIASVNQEPASKLYKSKLKKSMANVELKQIKLFSGKQAQYIFVTNGIRSWHEFFVGNIPTLNLSIEAKNKNFTAQELQQALQIVNTITY